MKKDENTNVGEQGETLPKGHVIAEAVAISEVTEFVNQFKFKPIEPIELEKDFEEVIYAVQLGLLKLNEASPVLTLSKPVQALNGEVYKAEITFKTRIVASQQERIARGLDLKKQPLLYIQKLQAYLIGEESIAMLDKYSNVDWKIIEQLTGLFM